LSLRLSAEPEDLKSRFATLKDAQNVANLLEIDRQHLNYHLYISPRSTRYTIFDIPKRSGGTRKISTPVTALKIIQQKLNQVLQQVYKLRPSVHSFISERSILTNARAHVRREWVLNIDLKDFFPSITFPRVRGLFIAKPYQIVPAAATVLAQICCFEGRLPQGAPTSPIVSNMICAKLDNELYRLARKHRCRYTRYADDITFSISESDFPAALAKINSQGQLEVGNELNRIIHENWFEVNPDKVRLRRRNPWQEVTGLTVNERPNVKRQYVRQLRAMLHAWERFGIDNAQQEFLKRHDKKHRAPFKDPPSLEQVIDGKIGFLGMVIGKDNPVYLRYHRQFKRLCLLKMYEDLEKSQDYHSRGYLLEKLLNQMFKLYEIPATTSFRRNQNAEQIDGAFEISGYQYIVECRWREKLADIGQVDGLKGKVNRSGMSARGFFLSVNGWSDNVPNLMKQNPDKNIILMNGEDLRCVLDTNRIDLQDFIKAKIRQLSLETEPHYGAAEYLRDHRKA
jgi:RNA-directed DNA polymerase